MSYEIVRKIVMNTGADGYMLYLDGLQMVVSERDLYSQDIVTGLIDSGYEYINYYGDIRNPQGVEISSLESTPLQLSDNEMFYGILGEQALTEQQMLEYFTGNNSEIPSMDMKSPTNITIHTRDELISYLRGFAISRKVTIPMSDCMPINSFTAPEALFTLEELWSNPNLYEFISLLSTRRTFVNNTHLTQLQDSLIKSGVLTEDKRWDKASLLEAYSSWGPDGINCKVAAKAIVEGHCSSINLPRGASVPQYTSNDFIGIQQSILNEGIESYHARIKTREVFVLLGKDGTVHFNGEKYPWQQVISCRTNIFFNDSIKSDIKKRLRESASWPTEYKAVLATYVEENPRVVLVCHDGNGVMHEWRCDMNYVSLVTTTNCLYAYPFASIRTEYDSFIPLFDVYKDKEYMLNNIFYKLALEKSSEIRVKPLYSSTIKMCESCGLTYEQTIDYIEVCSGRKAASSILHGAIPSSFYEVFGDKIDESTDMNELDRLDALLSRFYERADADQNSEERWNHIDKLRDMGGGEDFNLAMFIYNSRIQDQIEAVTDIRDDKTALHQAAGAVEDLSLTNVNAISYGLRTLYYIMNKEVNNNKLLQFVIKIGDTEATTSNKFPILLKDMMWKMAGQARGCLQDVVDLRYEQYTTGKQFVYVTDVVVEKSADVIEGRRHYSFNGYSMHSYKQLAEAFNSIRKQALEVLNRIPFIYDELRDSISKLAVVKAMDHIWLMLFGDKSFKINDKGDCVFSLKLPDMEHENFIVVEVSLPKDVYNNIIVNKSNIKPICSTLFSFCRNSVVSVEGKISYEAVLLNARINPWYINPTKSDTEFPLYNGSINIFPKDNFDELFSTRLPDVYSEVSRLKGRLPISIYDDEFKNGLFDIDLSYMMVDEDIFTEVNKRNQIQSNSIPISMYNYYLEDDSKIETTKQYVQRFNLTAQIAAKEGKALAAIPLKSDNYFKISADIYGVKVYSEPVFMDNGESLVFNAPVRYNNNDLTIGVNNLNKIRFDTMTSYDMITNIVATSNGFTPTEIYFVGSGFIFIAGSDQSTKISDMTIAKAVELAGKGILLQISADSFLLKGINTTAILEVHQ